MTPELRRDLRLAGLLGLVSLLGLLALQWIEPHFFLRDDNATHFLPAYNYAYESVVGEGEIPLLNHHQMFGGTFLASGQTGVFLFAMYPLRGALELLGLDAIYLIDVLATLHFLLAGLGMFVLLRHLRLRPALVFPLALCWTFLPVGLVVGRSWIFISYLIAYLPWSQWLLLRCLEKPSARRCFALVLLKVFFLFTGYLHYGILTTFYEILFLLIYWLRARGARLRRQVAMMGAVYLLTGLLAAPLLVPTWNAKAVSWRRAEPLPAQVALAASLRPVELLKANLFAGNSVFYYELSNSIFFVGPLCCVGLALALGPLRRRDARQAEHSWVAYGLVGLFALLMSTSLYALLLKLPIFNVLRFPFKGFPIALFLLLLPASRFLALWAGEQRSRLRLAAGLVWLNLLLQLLTVGPAHWRAPISKLALDRTVAELRAAPLIQAIGVDGRVALLADSADPPDRGNSLALGYLYATLAGKYHVHGYDPLKARLNVEMGYDILNDGEIRLLPDTWPRFLQTCTARYFLLRASSRLMAQVAATPGLRRLASEEDLVLFENPRALPLVGRLEDGQPIPFRWRTNGIEIDLPPEFRGGPLLVDVAGLAGYRWYLDGVDQGPPELVGKRPVLEPPPGAGHVELRYRDSGLRLGLALCAGGLLLALFGLRRGDDWLSGGGQL